MNDEADNDDRRLPFDAPAAPVFRCLSCGATNPPEEGRCAHCGSDLATRRCVTCFQLNPSDAHRCSRCGSLLPDEALSGERKGTCPDCHVELTVRAFGVVGYAECPRCGGLFLKPKAFDEVSRDAATRGRIRAEKKPVAPHPQLGPHIHPRARALPPVKYRSCPECRKLMNRQNYAGGSGIVIDICGKHGVWFDRGELTAIVDFLESGGYERLKKRERERLEEEVRSLESQKSFQRSVSLPISASDRDLKGLETAGELLGWIRSLFHWK